MDGSTNWSEQVLAEFHDLITGGQRLIHIHNDASIPLVFADIYSDVAAYKDRSTPSFSQMLMAKGLLRQTRNADIISAWYNKECGKLIESDATESLRWIDVHEFQKPAICFSAAAAQPSHCQSYVVGNVMAVPSLSATATTYDKKQAATKEKLPRTTADCLQKEKMERVDSWLKHESHKSWMQEAVKLRVDDAPVASREGGWRPENKRVEVGASQTDGKPYKVHGGEQCDASDQKSGCTNVPLQSSFLPSSVVPDPQQQKLSRSQLKMHDMPERDVIRHDHGQTKTCNFEGLVNRQQHGDSSSQKCSVSNSVPLSCQSKTPNSRVTRDPVRGGQGRPLFTREETTSVCSKSPSCSPEEKKADISAICNTVAPKRADDISIHGHFPKFGAFDVQLSTDAETSPPLAETETDSVQTKSELSVVTLRCDEESVASKKSSTTSTPLKNEGVSSSSDDPACTLADRLPTPTILSFSLLPAMEDVSSDHNVSDVDVHSESSSSLLTVAKTHVMESDSYLTANETSSIVSDTSPRKLPVVSSVSRVELSPEVSREDPVLVSDEETVLNDHTADVMKMSHFPVISSVSRVELSPEVSREDSLPVSDEETMLNEHNEHTVNAADVTKMSQFPVVSSVSCVELSPEVSREDSLPVSDEETVLNEHTISAGDVTKMSECLPSVKLEIPDSHQMFVFLSFIESPHRFWVNVLSENIEQLDWVTEALSTMDLKPADLSSDGIELHRCYAVQSVDDKLFYRAKVLEICYGDAHCKHSSSDDCETCQCDQLMRTATDTVKALRVHLCLQFSSMVM